MPYSQNTDMPSQVTTILSEHAQDIYRDAYNSAWDDYEELSDDGDDSKRDEAARGKAWDAVEKAYEKDEVSKWNIHPSTASISSVGLVLVVLAAAATFLYLRSNKLTSK
jgi:cation transport regulator